MNDLRLSDRERVAAAALARLLRLALPEERDRQRHGVVIELVARGSARLFHAGLERAREARSGLEGAVGAFRAAIDAEHGRALRGEIAAGLAEANAGMTIPGEEVARQMRARAREGAAREEEIGPDAWLLERIAEEYRLRAEEASTVDADAWQHAERVADRLTAISASLAGARERLGVGNRDEARERLRNGDGAIIGGPQLILGDA